MKKVLVLAMLLCVGLGFGQEKEATEKITTSIEEYNYLTKGYADDVSKGRDIKNGYELKEFYTFDNENINFSFTYHKFIETATNKTKAVLVVAKKKSKNKVKYLCIPFNNKELLEDSATDAAALGITMTAVYNRLNYINLSSLLNTKFNN